MKKRFQTKQVVMAAGMAVFMSALAGGALLVPAKEGSLEVWDASFTEAEYDKLRELQFDGYEDLTVSAYQAVTWALVDEPECMELLDRMSGSKALFEKRDEDARLHFLFYVLMPLTAEQWQTRTFGGYAQESFAESGQTAAVEYNYTLSITDADALTVRGYDEAQDGITGGMGQLLKGRSKEELADAEKMQAFLDKSVEQLEEQWSGNGLEIEVEYCFCPLELPENEEYAANGQWENGECAADVPKEDEEPRSFPNAAREDYQSLLTLKTPDYQDLPVQAFNMELLEWANENQDRLERIDEDTRRNDFQVKLSEEEHGFVTRTVFLSGRENGKYVQSSYTGRPEEDPCYEEYLPQKGGGSAWCDLYYTFTYHIADKKKLTVGERDRLAGGMIDDVRTFWEGKDLDALLQMEKADIVAELQKIAEKNSSDGLTISVSADGTAFEAYDERNAYDRLVSYRTKDYEKMYVADFNAALCDTEDEFGRLLDANAELAGTISEEDENYDFLVNTMRVSLSELYCEKFGETYGLAAVLSKQARPCNGWGRETMYEFQFYANMWISYAIAEPETLTVGERNRALQSMKDALQGYVDGLSEEALLGSDMKKLLERKGEELAKKLSGDKMKLWCEVQSVEMFRN